MQEHENDPTLAYPMFFTPVYKDYLWGGNRIAEKYGRDHVPEVCAESWELADRPEGMSKLANGTLAGITLRDLTTGFSDELLGKIGSKRFPVLCKVIDASKRLSVQVHPDNDSAERTGGEAKTEMWYVLETNEGAGVFAGLQPGVDEAQMRSALENKTVKDLLVFTPVTPGDVVYIPGGTVHSLGEGCLVYEVQQNSNTTYRLYDWDRVDSDGNPRELHIEKALKVINWKAAGTRFVHKPPVRQMDWRHAGVSRAASLECPFFELESVTLWPGPPCRLRSPGKATVLFVYQGCIRIDSEHDRIHAGAGTTLLLPAALQEYRLSCEKQKSMFLQIGLD